MVAGIDRLVAMMSLTIFLMSILEGVLRILAGRRTSPFL